MSDEAIIERVARAASRRREAHAEYVAAIVRARAAGFTLQRIGDACGVTKWAIVGTLERAAKEGGASDYGVDSV